jgi:arginase family enzyme
VLRLCLDKVEKVDIAVLGTVIDSGITCRPDVRFGPAHMREASRMRRSYHSEVRAYSFGVKHELITLLSRLPQEPSRATKLPA